MHCQFCGKKLALFRKSSNGDFCSTEHRVAYLTQQANLSLTRLLEVAPKFIEPAPPEEIDVAQFDAEDSPMVGAVAGGHAGTVAEPVPEPVAAGFLRNDISAATVGAPLPFVSEPRIRLRRSAKAPAPPPMAGIAIMPAAPVRMDNVAVHGLSEPLMTHGLVFSSLRLQPSLPAIQLGLRQANLVMPWSVGEESDFTLESLVAAVWAKPGDLAPKSLSSVLRMSLRATMPVLDLRAIADWAEPEAAPVRDPADDWDDFPEALTALNQLPDAPAPVKTATDRWEEYLRQQTSRRARSFESELAELPVEAPAPVEAPPQPRVEWKPSGRLIPAVNVPRSQRNLDLYDDGESTKIQSKGRAGRIAPWMSFQLPPLPAAFGLVAVAFLVISSLALLMIEPSRSAGGSAGLTTQVSGLRNLIRARAAILLYDDFRSGLAAWDGPSGWAADWSYDQAGFLRPGKFGILKDTKGMANYKMEFLGQIERKSLGWVFRAKDDGNYVAAKITITRPGPLPSADLVHFSVTDGVTGPTFRKPLPFTIRNDTLYNVQMNVSGDQFVARVNGVLVDFWSDSKLSKGGVGFSSDVGEAARVRWLRVSDKDDFVGRVCSMLAARVAAVDKAGILRAETVPSHHEPLRLAPFVVVVPNF